LQYWLIMPAAGSGRRFGAAVPKQYLDLAGQPVIERALAVFLADSRCRGIVVALDPGDRRFESLTSSRDPRVQVVAGGAQRCDSVRNSLAAIAGGDDDWVLVHDAARPCLSRKDLDSLLATLADDPVGGLLATPLADTLKHADQDQRVTNTRSRESLWRALTPQMFRLALLREALRSAHLSGREPSDESQAVEWAGRSPRLVAGRPDNLKITSPADLALAAAVLSRDT
jgi:2-C-methyl-D-erythritol 4-phosphate cytidylyltransferase